MSNTTNTEIQEIKQLIQDLSERVDKRFDKIEEKVEKRFLQVEEKIESLRNQQVETEKSVVEVKGLMEGWKPMINKLPDLSQQLGQQQNWKQIAIIVISSGFAAFLGWLIRGGKF